MIKNFKCGESEKIFLMHFSCKFPVDIQRRARVKLLMLHAAMKVGDLSKPPSNNLEKLRGNRKGQMSIRVNDQWRICFLWEENHAYQVEIVDYHH